VIQFEIFERSGCGVAAMTDRDDGNFSYAFGEKTEVRSARERICTDAGLDADNLVLGQQVHGNQIATVSENHRGRGARSAEDALPDTDGLLTRIPGLSIAVLVADCVPLFLFDPGSGAVGVIHAGRQGTRSGIASRAIQALQDSFGTKPANVHALIGPSAGPCCYEVSPEVAEDFASAGLRVERGRFPNLWLSNKLQLEEAGIPAANIIVFGECTICSGRFHSHRVRPGSGRNLALIAC
jgi:purine-nucleoside/S-methyl-5'-thioadenosine phosphorylase / adenosine deaminase